MGIEERAKEKASEGLKMLENGVPKITLTAESDYDLILFSTYYNKMGYDVKSDKAIKEGKVNSYPINIIVKNTKGGVKYNA